MNPVVSSEGLAAGLPAGLAAGLPAGLQAGLLADLSGGLPGGLPTGGFPLLAIALSLAGAVVLAVMWLAGFLAARPVRAAHALDSKAKAPAFWRWAAWVIDPLAAHLSPWLAARTRFAVLERLRRGGLDASLAADQYVAGKCVSGVLGVTLVSVVWSPVGLAPLFVLVGAAALGFLLSDTWLRDRIQVRQRAVLRELPFYLDVITLAVESGLNLASALAQAADKGPPGPLREEFERVLRDLRTGRVRAEALRAMAERLALPAVGSLVSALIVAEQQGSALAPLLRAQAEQRRNERFQRAEKLALEAPVKMLLPLLVFIFPCTFAVLLFPIVGRMLMEGWLK